MIWTAKSINDLCGGCPKVIPARTAVAIFNGKQHRCPDCAERMGYFVDQAAVAAALKALDDKASEPKPVSYATRRPEEGFVPLTAIADEVVPVQAPIPFHKLSPAERRHHNKLAGNED